MASQLAKFRITAAISLFAIYLPGVISTGIWSDDYPSLLDPISVQIHASRDGRPIYGFLLQFMFDLTNTVSNLWLIRFFALIGLLLLNDLVIKILSKSRTDLRVTLASVGAFSIASFQVNIHWATAFLFCWVAYFALLGYTLMMRDSKKSNFAGVLLLTVSSLSYPVLTFFILPVVFLLSYETDNEDRKLKKDSILAILGIALSAFLALLINLISLRARGLTFNDRVSFISISDLPSQILWFLSRPFILTFRGYSIESPGLIEALGGLLLVNLLIITGITIKHKTFPKVLKYYALLISFTLFSMTPLFFPDQQQVDVRYVTVGSWLVSYMSVSGVFLILGKISLGGHRVNRSLVSVVFVIVFFLSINSRYFSVIQPIYNRTSTFISSELSSCGDQEILSGVYVLARETAWPSKQNIGLFSQITDLASGWVPLNAVMVEIQKNPKFSGVSVSWAEEERSGCVIDLNRFEVYEQ
jgi:hypothetical protein